MNYSELLELLKNYYEVTQVPMYLYSGNILLEQIPPQDFKLPLEVLCFGLLQGQQLPVCCTMVQQTMFTGLIRCEKAGIDILVGPALFLQPVTSQAERLLEEMHMDPVIIDKFLLWLNTLPVLTAKHFQNILHFLDYAANGSPAPRVRFIPAVRVDNTSEIRQRPASEHIDIVQEYLYSTHILKLVASGNVAELQKSLHKMLKQNWGPQMLPLPADRLIKNLFIGTNTLVCHAAISGGLGIPVAMALADHFLVKIETCRTYDAALFLLTQMIITYTKESAKSHHLKSNSPLVHKVITSTQNHIYEKWTTADIALELDMDLSYLCHHFKQETGETISYYINKIKVEESQRLLESTSLSLAQIAMQLGYSSQSYFQRVFKKITGITPKKYLSKTVNHQL